MFKWALLKMSRDTFISVLSFEASLWHRGSNIAWALLAVDVLAGKFAYIYSLTNRYHNVDLPWIILIRIMCLNSIIISILASQPIHGLTQYVSLLKYRI